MELIPRPRPTSQRDPARTPSGRDRAHSLSVPPCPACPTRSHEPRGDPASTLPQVQPHPRTRHPPDPDGAPTGPILPCARRTTPLGVPGGNDRIGARHVQETTRPPRRKGSARYALGSPDSVGWCHVRSLVYSSRHTRYPNPRDCDPPCLRASSLYALYKRYYTGRFIWRGWG